MEPLVERQYSYNFSLVNRWIFRRQIAQIEGRQISYYFYCLQADVDNAQQRSRIYLGLPCSRAQSLGSFTMPLSLLVVTW